MIGSYTSPEEAIRRIRAEFQGICEDMQQRGVDTRYYEGVVQGLDLALQCFLPNTWPDAILEDVRELRRSVIA